MRATQGKGNVYGFTRCSRQTGRPDDGNVLSCPAGCNRLPRRRLSCSSGVPASVRSAYFNIISFPASANAGQGQTPFFFNSRPPYSESSGWKERNERKLKLVILLSRRRPTTKMTFKLPPGDTALWNRNSDCNSERTFLAHWSRDYVLYRERILYTINPNSQLNILNVKQ